MRNLLIPVVGVSLVGMSMLAGAANAQYVYVEIPLLPGTVQGGAYGVNDAGDVVGWCRASDNMHYGFLYESDTGNVINLGALGTSAAGLLIGPRAINDDREVVGVWGCACAGGARAFYWNPNLGFMDISYQPRPGDVVFAGAFGINRDGQVAGVNVLLCPNVNFAVQAAALWTDPTDPQTPPVPVFPSPFACGIGGFGLGINNIGAVCGWVQVSEGGFSWTRATVAGVQLPTFSPAQGGHSTAFAINNGGVACGYSEDRSGSGPASSACYWLPGGQINRLNGIPAGTIFGQALALNDEGDVVGWTGPSTGSRAVIWPGLSDTPIDLNTLLINSPGTGRILFTAEDISNTGFVVGRLSQGLNARAYLLVPCDLLEIGSPRDAVSCASGPATFSVSISGSASFQWQVNTGTPESPMWCDLVDGVVGGACAGGSSLAMFSGALTSSLSITSMGLADQREYRCVASTGCGLRTSEPALLTVCLPDVNCDLETDILDFLDFLDAFGVCNGQPSPCASSNGISPDFNGDTIVDILDFLDFIDAFGRGC